MTDKPHYLPGAAFTHLCMACQVIGDAVEGYGCFLVGSALERRDWRDVDVRCILEDAEYDRLFVGEGGGRDALFGLLCLAISSWLSQKTGLPVDFQFQRFTEANAKHPGKRNALFWRHPASVHAGEWPSHVMKKDGTDA